jgi:hypothetical protein
MKRREWAKHIEDWKRSGLEAADYGKRHGMDPKKLYWWSWFLRARAKRARVPGGAKLALLPRPQAAVLPVRLRALPARRQATGEVSRVEVALPSGAVIRATSAVDAAWLGKLVVCGTAPC